MEYTTLGNSGIRVSKICLGTMTFGEQNTEAEGHEQMDYALTQGINFFDTAEMYSVPARKETQGSTERILGTWFRARKNRDKIVLATKITGPSPTFKFLRDPINFSEAQIREALEGSLTRLQTDYVDLYQLHWPERKMNMFGKRGFEYDPSDPWTDNFSDVIRTMDALIREGKIRTWGVSNENSWGLMRMLHLADLLGLPRPVSIQNPYSLLNRLFEVGLAEAAIREQVGLLAYSPMAFGVLSGKYDDPQADISASRLTLFTQYARYSNPSSREAAREYARIAREAGLQPAQMALAFVHSRPFVASNIIGATTMEQLKENIESMHVALAPEVIHAIEEVHRRIPDPAP
ncbi:MAG: NADP(H)-dependent aldo-keto reductase [Haliscomenobacter sp.]|nr:NADP(H)-dependent aldo-keto reductase [Haliscomenobacter sp.]